MNDFFDHGQQIAIKPYPSLVVGVLGQTAQRDEVARYIALSFLLSRICAASSINRGRTLEGYASLRQPSRFVRARPDAEKHDSEATR